MLKKTLLLLAAGAVITACNGDTKQTSYEKNGTFITARTYTEVRVTTDCMPRFNCYAQLQFQPNGEGTIIVTDIANRVNYKIANEHLTATLVGAGDIPKKLEFDIIDNANSLVRQDNGMIFKLNSSSLEVYKATGARQCEQESGTSLSASAAALSKAGVATTGSYCGYISGIAFPAVCGGGTASVNIHAISSNDLAAVQALGYTLVSESKNPIEKTVCP